MKEFIKKRKGTIIFFTIIVAFILYGIFNIMKAKSNAIGETVYEYDPPESNVDMTRSSNYEKIAESKNLELYFDDNKGTIQVKNTESGYVWKTVVEEEDYPINDLNQQWSGYLQSMFTIDYNDITKRDVPPATTYAGNDCDYLEVQYLDNGVEVKYGFTDIGLFVTFQYLLENGRFIVRIPYEGYEENLQYCITSIDVLPFFGSAKDDVDGYMLYPDGSGALTSYGNVSNRTSKVKQGILNSYSNKRVDIEEFLYEDNYERYVASVPLFGIKNNNDALMAVATDGAEETGIITYPSGIVVDLNHINFEVYVRSVFNVDMFNIATEDDTVATGKEIQRIDEKILPQDREFTYFMFSGEDANYSKMADAYRQYLIEEDRLANTIEDGSEIPLALEFLMGVTEAQMISEKYITMTSFEDMISILERLKSQGVENSKILLSSWQKGGVSYPEYWPIARQIGGVKGLEKVNEYLLDNPGNDLFLENNFTFAIKENGDFSATNDVVYSGVNIPITLNNYDTETWYMLNPQVTYDRAMDFVKEINPFEQVGVGYEYLGRMVYPDYNKANSFTRNETLELWKKLFSDTKTEGKKIAIEGFHDYTYANADYLYSVPLNSYGLAITDASVPFVQMVISGLIPYSSKAGNLSYDLDIQKLQWIEYGSLPYFSLTYEDAILLKETKYNSLFTSTYDKWEERVVSVYKEFKDNFSHIYGQQMILHEIIDNDLVKIGYEDGTIIYLNYSDEIRTIEGHTIPQKNYIITS